MMGAIEQNIVVSQFWVSPPECSKVKNGICCFTEGHPQQIELGLCLWATAASRKCIALLAACWSSDVKYCCLRKLEKKRGAISVFITEVNWLFTQLYYSIENDFVSFLIIRFLARDLARRGSLCHVQRYGNDPRIWMDWYDTYLLSLLGSEK